MRQALAIVSVGVFWAIADDAAPAEAPRACARHELGDLDRADALRRAIELSPNRGDLRLKLGATYVSLRFWPEALEQLRVAEFFLPAEEHERVHRLVETADERYQARFFPPDRTE
jgi:hypothetical protein